MSDAEILQQAEETTEEVMSHETLYKELRVLVESLESDVLKSQKGNKAASTRLRKSLRLLKHKSGDFVKFTLGKL